MPTELLRAFEEQTGFEILEGYGLTEATCVSSVNPIAGERRRGSIGLRLPGQLMKAVVLDERGGFVRDCDTGEVGVIVVAGPNVFDGYRNGAQNEGLWVDCGDGRRWLDTGDLGRQDGDGYFWLTGRKKELIIRGGHNIDPAAIEEPLHRHPAVQLAAAVGRPDAHAGELPVAYVQPKAGAVVSEGELPSFWLPPSASARRCPSTSASCGRCRSPAWARSTSRSSSGARSSRRWRRLWRRPASPFAHCTRKSPRKGSL